MSEPQVFPATLDYGAAERDIMAMWEQNDTYKTQRELAEGRPSWDECDGPPFATGTMHYGHMVASAIKDITLRYAGSTGHYVHNIRPGFDCHGLPVEMEAEKLLGKSGLDAVEEMGIDKYNEVCRSIVLRYADDWQEKLNRFGRWLNWDTVYKTMDPNFMESVWWVFSELFKKGLVYRGFKVMPFSTHCNTPLSNFEANLNYKPDTKDPAVVVSFPVVDQPGVSLVAWTTTPWTLPSNLALCVHPELVYVRIRDVKTGAKYICGKSRIVQLYPKSVKKGYAGGEFEIEEEFPGATLAGLQYEPLFEYFRESMGETAWRVLVDDYVTDDAGTGVVHQAPAFGEDDYRVCLAAGVIAKGGFLPCPVNESGRFTPEASDYAGVYVKDADDKICADLKERGRLVSKGVVVHSYPFCWRSDTPLIYKAVPSWFVRVESIKDRLLACNEQTYWVPASVKEKRFHNWLRDARDWAVSRNRFWGTPLPIWTSDDGEEIVVVGSVQELEELSGQRVSDLHRHFVDDITIPSKTGRGVLRRVPEVFDCWFESGSMPYSQIHYPFEHKEEFASRFPADFIAEGLDQTRGWFYTLMVLSTALFDKPAFKSVIVNGLVLAEDGKKMSKRLRNYPDPTHIVESYGADALRLYLINSPVVRAEPLRFSELGVRGVLQQVMNPWYSAFRFFMTTKSVYEHDMGHAFVPSEDLAKASPNDMDRWIQAALHSLIKFVRTEMGAFRLYTVVPRLLDFIEQLTNWYLKLNRGRVKGVDNTPEDRATALSVLYSVLLQLAVIMAPFTPFITEYQYQHLRQLHPARDATGADAASQPGSAASVHHLLMPEFDPSLLDDEMLARVEAMVTVVELGRKARERRTLGMKYPLAELLVITPNPAQAGYVEAMAKYIKAELNVDKLTVTAHWQEYCEVQLKPNTKELGPRLGKGAGAVFKALAGFSSEDAAAFLEAGGGEVAGQQLSKDDVFVVRTFTGETPRWEPATDDSGAMVAAIDTLQTPEMKRAGLAREITARVQKLRKAAGLQVSDNVDCFVTLSDPAVQTEVAALQALKTAAHSVATLGKSAQRPPAPGKGGAAAGDAKGGKGAKADGKGKGEGKGAKADGKGKKGGKGDKAAAAPAAPAPAVPSAAQQALSEMALAVVENLASMEATIRSQIVPASTELAPLPGAVLIEEEEVVAGVLVHLSLVTPTVWVAPEQVLAKEFASAVAGKQTWASNVSMALGNKTEAAPEAVWAHDLVRYVRTLNAAALRAAVESGTDFPVTLNGVTVALKPGLHLFTSARGIAAAHPAECTALWSKSGLAALVGAK